MKKTIKMQLLVTGIAAACVLGVYATSTRSGDGPGLPPPPAKSKAYPKVTTIQPVTGSFTAKVKGYGQISPVQTLNLAAEVSGKVVELSPAFKSGERLRADDVLLRIDDHIYREAVASAESALATAEVTLLQQQLNRTQAKAEWKRSGLAGSPDSRLALYEPQVKAAQAAVEYARRTLKKAKADLNRTVVRIPFNALVISRSIELGSYVQPGSDLAVLYGTDQVELILPLSSKDWTNLHESPATGEKWVVELSDTESDSQWNGYVDRVAQHIDSNTRQRSLIVRVDNPLDQSPPLYPGTFIEAGIPGKTLKEVWQLPASAVTQNNQIWLIDEASMLTRVPADVRLRMVDKAYLTPDETLKHPLVVTLPLTSYLPGMKVKPTLSEGPAAPGEPGIPVEPALSAEAALADKSAISPAELYARSQTDNTEMVAQ